MIAMITPTMIAGTRVCAGFCASRCCVSFGTSADVACVFALGACASILSLRGRHPLFQLSLSGNRHAVTLW